MGKPGTLGFRGNTRQLQNFRSTTASSGRPFRGQRRQTVVAAAGGGIFKGQGVEVQVLRAVGILGGRAASAWEW